VKHLNLSSYSDRVPYLVTAFTVTTAIAISLNFLANIAPEGLSAQTISNVYKPTPISSGVDINDILTDKDIPTGQKGFARDYVIAVQKDDRLEITVNAGGFDTVLSVLDSKGEVIAENDDAIGEGTNSMIFFKVIQSGKYTVRVSSFGGSSGGKFTLKVNKLRIVN
jgi:Bacterial pre-peptidase C-terminal domain